jgi:transcriptional regulator with XRE-family HTH domain
MNAKLVGERVRALRKAKRWSQEELADRAKVSQGTLSRIENGHVDMRMDTLTFVAMALGVPVHDLLLPPNMRAAG